MLCAGLSPTGDGSVLSPAFSVAALLRCCTGGAHLHHNLYTTRENRNPKHRKEVNDDVLRVVFVNEKSENKFVLDGLVLEKKTRTSSSSCI